MALHWLAVDATSEARSLALIPAVQSAYDAGGYPPLTITWGYVLLHAIRPGLSYWIPPRYQAAAYPRGAPENLPTVAKLTPAVAGSTSHLIDVPAADIAYANEIIAKIGGGALEDVLGCALCTGLAALSGSPLQVGPWLP